MPSSNFVAQQNYSLYAQAYSPPGGYRQQNSVDNQPFNPGILIFLILGATCAVMVLLKAK